VDLEETPVTMGVFLEMNPETERFKENQAADALLTRLYRKPYVVPSHV
jgi:hypothetical protein